MSTEDFAIRLCVAFVLGCAVGLERQIHQKSAGLRTNTLVAVGAAIYVLLSVQITEGGGDVSRIIGQVVTGIGFLGAGIIFKEGFTIHGLTTAATVWCSSAIGCCAGAGMFKEAAISAGMVLFINMLRFPIRWLSKNDDESNSPQ